MPATPKLSTRSYAILGLLAIRDWTTYELASQMERGVGDIWAAARSMVYSEPKHLADLGLVRASAEHVGRRERTRYGITPEGLAVLRAWLAEPGAPPAMQFEGLLKILLADATQLEAVQASITAAITWADDLQDVGRLVAAEYAAGKGPFQERAHLIAISFAFLWEYAEFVRRWACWAQQEALRWPAAVGVGAGAGDPGASAAGRPAGDVFRRALDGVGILAPPD